MREENPLLWLFGAEVQEIIDEWEGAPRAPRISSSKRPDKSTNIDQISTHHLNNILLTYGKKHDFFPL